MSDALHPAAVIGFGRGAQVYRTSRPGYPAAIEGWLRDRIGLAPGKIVLELGAGTGKFTAALVPTGAEIVALDPVPAMLDQFAQAYPDIRRIAGRAEAIPLPDASLDAVVCATAFHWFATAEAIAEIRRVLRIGGALGLVWNLRDERIPWVAALSALTYAWQTDSIDRRDERWRDVFPATGFGPLAESCFDHAHVGAAEDVVVGRTLSTSFIAALPDAAQHDVAAEVRALVAATPALAEDPVTFPYVTVAYDCRRIA